LKVLEHNKSIY